MKKGYYLYCIREKTNSKFFTWGIDRSDVFTILYKDLEAVVSKISLKKFESKEIQRKAQEDLGWIKMEALIHEKIIEQAMTPVRNRISNKVKGRNRFLTVIPMKFGVIFKTKENLEEILKKNYSQFKKKLKSLTGKQEWAVKVYLNRKVFEKDLKKISPTIQKKEKKIILMPEGAAYFMQKQIDDAILKETDKVLCNYEKKFFKILKQYTETRTTGKILAKELTGKSLPMILNGIFLVSEKKLDRFFKKVKKLNEIYKLKGFYFEHSGPWPPYNFV